MSQTTKKKGCSDQPKTSTQSNISEHTVVVGHVIDCGSSTSFTSDQNNFRLYVCTQIYPR